MRGKIGKWTLWGLVIGVVGFGAIAGVGGYYFGKYGAPKAVRSARSAVSGARNRVAGLFSSDRSGRPERTNGFAGNESSGAASQPSPSPAPLLPSVLEMPKPAEPQTPELPKSVGGGGRSPGGRCTAAEYRGDALTQVIPSQDSWAEIMAQFHGAKKDLLNWLERNRAELSPTSYAVMQKQVRELKIQRPPTPQDPDLSWRGILVYALDTHSGPLVRVGGGFLNLVDQEPKRARFELTRLVAQAWAPCELRRVGVSEEFWQRLLACLKINEEQACAEGSFSESGWAVSSAIAYVLADPGCRLPVFENPEFQACLDSIRGKKL